MYVLVCIGKEPREGPCLYTSYVFGDQVIIEPTQTNPLFKRWGQDRQTEKKKFGENHEA